MKRLSPLNSHGRLRTKCGALLLTTLLLGACAASAPDAEPVQAEGPQRTHYTLRAGPTVHFTRPLPARTDIYVDWHYDTGSVETYTGFRGWDFTGDGRYGMLEVLDEEGHVEQYLYDFTGEGVPQLRRDAQLSEIRPD